MPIFSIQIVFFTFHRKSLETNFYWQLMIIILCLNRFSLWWLLKDFFVIDPLNYYLRNDMFIAERKSEPMDLLYSLLRQPNKNIQRERKCWSHIHSFHQGVKNIGRWTQQQDGGKSWRHQVSAGNALTSLAGIHKKINLIRDDYRNNSYNF